MQRQQQQAEAGKSSQAALKRLLEAGSASRAIEWPETEAQAEEGASPLAKLGKQRSLSLADLCFGAEKDAAKPRLKPLKAEKKRLVQDMHFVTDLLHASTEASGKFPGKQTPAQERGNRDQYYALYRTPEMLGVLEEFQQLSLHQVQLQGACRPSRPWLGKRA
eukprot:scaffold24_cov245-Pinguiococcus_pyrenoidosus.AAC.1